MTTDLLFAWHSLTARVSLVDGNRENGVVVDDGHDVLLVDTKEADFVVSTHHHMDHVMGNPSFNAERSTWLGFDELERAAAGAGEFSCQSE